MKNRGAENKHIKHKAQSGKHRHCPAELTVSEAHSQRKQRHTQQDAEQGVRKDVPPASAAYNPQNVINGSQSEARRKGYGKLRKLPFYLNFHYPNILLQKDAAGACCSS